MTYPADFLTWLEALDSRFNTTAGHIWEAAQKAERERIKEIINGVDVHSNWDNGVLSTLRKMQDTILEKIDER